MIIILIITNNNNTKDVIDGTIVQIAQRSMYYVVNSNYVITLLFTSILYFKK